ncbi:MAG: RNA 2',3'-cyclic phosphodiesterase [Nanoarchaeota archaeon]
MPRLFLAIDIPAQPWMQELQVQIRQQAVKPVDHFHITLKFLGDVEQHAIQELQTRLKRITHQPFMITTSRKLGAFPNRRRPSVLWVGVASKQLVRLQQKIDSLLADVFAVERNYVPHITIARARNEEGKKVLKEKMEHPVPSMTHRVTSFKLYQSELTPQGPIHTIRKRYKL